MLHLRLTYLNSVMIWGRILWYIPLKPYFKETYRVINRITLYGQNLWCINSKPTYLYISQHASSHLISCKQKETCM